MNASRPSGHPSVMAKNVKTFWWDHRLQMYGLMALLSYIITTLLTMYYRFSLSMEMSRLTRDGTAEPVSRDQILRHARGQGNIIFPVQMTTSRIGNLTRLIHTLLYVMTIHTYIHTVCFALWYVWWLCMAINISVQHNGRLLLDSRLLIQGYYHHREPV